MGLGFRVQSLRRISLLRSKLLGIGWDIRRIAKQLLSSLAAMKSVGVGFCALCYSIPSQIALKTYAHHANPAVTCPLC